MSASYTLFAAVDLNPFAADPSPNASAPLAARLFEIPDRTVHGALTTGFKFYTKYTTPSAGGLTLDGTVWMRDEATGNWVKAVDFTGLAEYEGVQIANVAPGVVYVQITGISAGTIDNVDIFAAPI